MTQNELEALAYDEARRIIEEECNHYNPYTRIIECGEVPYGQQEEFCRRVEEELKLKGELINRDGVYFKILRYQCAK